MTGEAAVEFEGVWKTFPRREERVLLRTQLKRFMFGSEPSADFQALKDLTFRVGHGEGVAVLGANGAGKSTLLSLVAGLVPPDRGRLTVRGRVAPLLELGSGFHPDLTGIENARLNAALLGLDRATFKRVLPEMIEFAELTDFIDEPLRTYSTGMSMRLAFAVAVSVDPDVLLIDEVLAVGDRSFQTKCFNKVMEFREKGKTILCVSHAAGMVQHLCSRAIWLDHGDLMLDGPLPEVLDAYECRLQKGAKP